MIPCNVVCLPPLTSYFPSVGVPYNVRNLSNKVPAKSPFSPAVFNSLTIAVNLAAVSLSTPCKVEILVALALIKSLNLVNVFTSSAAQTPSPVPINSDFASLTALEIDPSPVPLITPIAVAFASALSCAAFAFPFNVSNAASTVAPAMLACCSVVRLTSVDLTSAYSTVIEPSIPCLTDVAN